MVAKNYHGEDISVKVFGSTTSPFRRQPFVSEWWKYVEDMRPFDQTGKMKDEYCLNSCRTGRYCRLSALIYLIGDIGDPAADAVAV
jgi:hypothetical protein